MEITIKPEMTVLSYKVNTTLLKINEHYAIPMLLYKQAAENGMGISGCQYWIYKDCYGDMNKEFTLEMIVPVQSNGNNNSQFELNKLEPFKCVTYLHQGSWNEFSEVYQQLVKEIMKKGFKMSNINREMYVNCDFEKPENCITEIQIGIE